MPSIPAAGSQAGKLTYALLDLDRDLGLDSLPCSQKSLEVSLNVIDGNDPKFIGLPRLRPRRTGSVRQLGKLERRVLSVGMPDSLENVRLWRSGFERVVYWN